MEHKLSPEKLDILALAQNAQSVQWVWGIDCSAQPAEFARLQHEASDPTRVLSIAATVTGALKPNAAGQLQPWLHVQAQTTWPLTCQRCLSSVDVPLSVDRWFRFAADEVQAAAEDEMADEDVLVLEVPFNALQLIEDELLMALPIIPMHDQCPEAALQAVLDLVQEAAALPDQSHPFASLDKLRQTRS
jgi:uncharacterized protein